VKIGPYEVLGELGRGGMGVVYRVRGAEGREAALKLLLRGSEDQEKVAAFEREVRLLRSFSLAEGFVPVIDTGSEQGHRYLVMPFLEGGTLRQRLKERKLGIDEAVALVAGLAETMGLAHEKGVVHRDLKPENVLFDREGRVFVADLGLGKHFRRDVYGASKSASLTETGVIAGTPGYMAPEQLQDSKRAQPRADVFSLGAILHEALTGKKPFEGAGLVGYIEALRGGSVVPSRLRAGVPSWLDEVVRRSLEQREAERFADGHELARALRAGGRGAGSRKRAVGAALALGVGVVALGTAIALWRAAPAVPPAPVPVVPRAPERHPSPPPVPPPSPVPPAEVEPNSAEDWVTRGNERFHRGDLAGAIADATKAIELDPGYALAWTLRGGVRLELGDLRGAVDDTTRAIELDPQIGSAWTARGLARGKMRDLEGALADTTKAVELSPSAPQGWKARGWARLELGRLDDAIADLAKGDRAPPRGRRGVVLARPGAATQG
jgi:serine/threonine-protein kinase